MKTHPKIHALFSAKRPFLLLLDYDGTLTDFSKNPNRSLLPTSTRKLLHHLRRKNPVVMITGRNLDRLCQVSGLGAFPAVGTHGFESRHLPKGLSFASLALQKKYKKEAAAIWKKAKSLHDLYPGIHIEPKPFSSTLHYRGTMLSTRSTQQLIKEFTARCRQSITPGLWTFQKGKKMIEVMPKGFSKAKAVKKLMNYYQNELPIYAGDDVADIPALQAVRKRGLAIAVGERIPASYCDLRFKTPMAFVAWLKKLDRTV